MLNFNTLQQEIKPETKGIIYLKDTDSSEYSEIDKKLDYFFNGHIKKNHTLHGQKSNLSLLNTQNYGNNLALGIINQQHDYIKNLNLFLNLFTSSSNQELNFLIILKSGSSIKQQIEKFFNDKKLNFTTLQF